MKQRSHGWVFFVFTIWHLRTANDEHRHPVTICSRSHLLHLRIRFDYAERARDIGGTFQLRSPYFGLPHSCVVTTSDHSVELTNFDHDGLRSQWLDTVWLDTVENWHASIASVDSSQVDYRIEHFCT